MNRFAITNRLKNHDAACGDLMTMAARELAAFFGAVTELLGSEQAEIWAEDWLHELMETSVLPASIRQWRLLTVKVTARLASRMNVSFEALATH